MKLYVIILTALLSGCAYHSGAVNPDVVERSGRAGG